MSFTEENILLVNEEDRKELCEEFGIQLEEIIGEGSFGVVFRGRNLNNNSLCAVKNANKLVYKQKTIQKNKDKYSLIEISILSGLNHPNIVKFNKIWETNYQNIAHQWKYSYSMLFQFIEIHSNKYIVMEYIAGGNLQQLIDKRKADNNPFNENEISQIMNGLLSALKFIHANNVVHRDIKPDNILIADQNDLSSIKLSDFGLSVKYKDGAPFSSYSQKCGTIVFMAPEVLQEKQYSKPVDIWSCGIILYLLFTMGKHPFKSPEESKDEYLQRVPLMDTSKPLLLNKAFPSELAKDLFMRMMTKEQSNRYTATQVLQHPFITRKLNSCIPLNFQEITRAFQTERKLIEMVQALMVIKHLKNTVQKYQENGYKVIKLPVNIAPQYGNSSLGQGVNDQDITNQQNVTDINNQDSPKIPCMNTDKYNSSNDTENQDAFSINSTSYSFTERAQIVKNQQAVFKQSGEADELSVHRSVDFGKLKFLQEMGKSQGKKFTRINSSKIRNNTTNQFQNTNCNQLSALNKVKQSLPQEAQMMKQTAANGFLASKQCVFQPYQNQYTSRGNQSVNNKSRLQQHSSQSEKQSSSQNYSFSCSQIMSPKSSNRISQNSLIPQNQTFNSSSSSSIINQPYQLGSRLGQYPTPNALTSVLPSSTPNSLFINEIKNSNNVLPSQKAQNLMSLMKQYELEEANQSSTLPSVQIAKNKLGVTQFSAAVSSKKELEPQKSSHLSLDFQFSGKGTRPKHPSYSAQSNMNTNTSIRKPSESQSLQEQQNLNEIILNNNLLGSPASNSSNGSNQNKIKPINGSRNSITPNSSNQPKPNITSFILNNGYNSSKKNNINTNNNYATNNSSNSNSNVGLNQKLNVSQGFQIKLLNSTSKSIEQFKANNNANNSFQVPQFTKKLMPNNNQETSSTSIIKRPPTPSFNYQHNQRLLTEAKGPVSSRNWGGMAIQVKDN